MTQADGWTLVEREFVIGHPVDALWALFEDVPRVAGCLPGVHVESAEADRFAGRAEIRFGPIGASFHGEGTRETDAEGRTGVIAGRGSDRRGHASLEAELRYAMSGEAASEVGPRTRVGLAIRFQIQGGLAQFNRSDLVESFADVMLAEFVGNCERRLAGEEVRTAAGASGLVLLWRMTKGEARGCERSGSRRRAAPVTGRDSPDAHRRVRAASRNPDNPVPCLQGPNQPAGRGGVAASHSTDADSQCNDIVGGCVAPDPRSLRLLDQLPHQLPVDDDATAAVRARMRRTRSRCTRQSLAARRPPPAPALGACASRSRSEW